MRILSPGNLKRVVLARPVITLDWRIGFGVLECPEKGQPIGAYSFRLTLLAHEGYCDPTLGPTTVNRTHWIIGLLLMATVVWASTVPRLDDPETAFNESDAVITLAPPASVGVNSLPSASDPMIVANLSQGLLRWVVNDGARSLARAPSHRPPDSFQKLLCTFLI